MRVKALSVSQSVSESVSQILECRAAASQLKTVVSKKKFESYKFGVRKLLCPKIFSSKKFWSTKFGPKNWSKKHLVKKKLSRENVWFKKKFGPKIIGASAGNYCSGPPA